MKTKEIKKMDKDEIVKAIREGQEKLREINFDTSGSRVKNTHEKKNYTKTSGETFYSTKRENSFYN